MGQFLQIKTQFSHSENIIENFDSAIRKNDRKIFGGLNYCFYVCRVIKTYNKMKEIKVSFEKKIKVSFEIENVSDETIKALQKYFYETLYFSELLGENEKCSNLELIELN